MLKIIQDIVSQQNLETYRQHKRWMDVTPIDLSIIIISLWIGAFDQLQSSSPKDVL